jgi:hypothetical protein
MPDDFVPDADAQEQRQAVRDDEEGTEDDRRPLRPDVPEADALEQQSDVPDDDDDGHDPG